MPEEPTIESVKLDLLKANATVLRRILLIYLIDVTVLARMDFLEGRIEKAQRCNEEIHRLAGFILKIEGENPSGSLESGIDMIVNASARRGRLSVLKSGIRRGEGPGSM